MCSRFPQGFRRSTCVYVGGISTILPQPPPPKASALWCLFWFRVGPSSSLFRSFIGAQTGHYFRIINDPLTWVSCLQLTLVGG